ncbi:MAG: low molecular weight phosphatase family protein [Archaeoglobaceae archaeon]
MKVLFVCVKNTARSVMAEAIFNSLAKKWKAESAGLQKAEKIDGKVRQILEKNGLKAKEKPRSIEEVKLDEYDLIVAVCDESCLILPSKRVLRWQIEDPVGKGDQAYEKAFKELEERIKKLIKELEG